MSAGTGDVMFMEYACPVWQSYLTAKQASALEKGD